MPGGEVDVAAVSAVVSPVSATIVVNVSSGAEVDAVVSWVYPWPPSSSVPGAPIVVSTTANASIVESMTSPWSQ